MSNLIFSIIILTVCVIFMLGMLVNSIDKLRNQKKRSGFIYVKTNKEIDIAINIGCIQEIYKQGTTCIIFYTAAAAADCTKTNESFSEIMQKIEDAR